MTTETIPEFDYSKIQIRVKCKGLVGTISGKSGHWYHVDWDGGKAPHCCNYYSEEELEFVEQRLSPIIL